MNTSIETNQAPRRSGTAIKLTALAFTAFLLPVIPASAAGLATHEQVTVLSPVDADANAWPVGSASQWNASINRAVNRVVSPSENVTVHTAQIEDHFRGGLAGMHEPDKTLVGFEIVVHQ